MKTRGARRSERDSPNLRVERKRPTKKDFISFSFSLSRVRARVFFSSLPSRRAYVCARRPTRCARARGGRWSSVGWRSRAARASARRAAGTCLRMKDDENITPSRGSSCRYPLALSRENQLERNDMRRQGGGSLSKTQKKKRRMRRRSRFLTLKGFRKRVARGGFSSFLNIQWVSGTNARVCTLRAQRRPRCSRESEPK